MDVNWPVVYSVAITVIVLLVGVLALWLNNGMDKERTLKALTDLFGYALAATVDFARDEAGRVTPEQLDAFSGAVYDRMMPMLPLNIQGAILSLYPKAHFCMMFREYWLQYLGVAPDIQATAMHSPAVRSFIMARSTPTAREQYSSTR